MLTTALVPVGAAFAGPGDACENRNNNTFDKLLQCVTLEGVREHQAEFQKIADNSDDPVYPGTRAAGTAGYAQSVEYVTGLLENAGYAVTLDPVDIVFNLPGVVRQLTPVAGEYESGILSGSGNGTVEAGVTVLDINLTPPRANTSGCQGAYTEAAVGAPILADPGGEDDFAGFTPGNIALVQRGGCSFALKALNAQAAGASAVLIFNQGDTPLRGPFTGNAVPPTGSVVTTISIPALGISLADGIALSQPGSTAFVEVRPSEIRSDFNVIAELAARTPTTSSWPVPTSTASSRDPGSTTTAPAPPPCSRPRS